MSTTDSVSEELLEQDGLMKTTFNPHLDRMMMTMDEEHDEFDPNEHWVSCWGRFCYEINPCQNWFLVEDPPFTDRTLDIPASFAPSGSIPVLSKSTSVLSSFGILAWSVVVEDHKGYFFAYFSSWSLIFAIIYHLFSLHNSMKGVPQPFSRARGAVRLCWFFFVVAAHAGLLDVILYWTVEFKRSDDEDDYDGKFDFRLFMLHGGIAMGVILDGFSVNVIPLRWMHFWGCCFTVTILYAAWTVIHAFFLWTGNPNEPNRNTIYEEIDWRNDWQMTLLRVCVTVFVVSPLVFAILWLMSLYKWCFCVCRNKEERRFERRRYLQQTNNLSRYKDIARQQLHQDGFDTADSHRSTHTMPDERDDVHRSFDSPTGMSDTDVESLTTPRLKEHSF